MTTAGVPLSGLEDFVEVPLQELLARPVSAAFWELDDLSGGPRAFWPLSSWACHLCFVSGTCGTR
jgi:hypothetical protein